MNIDEVLDKLDRTKSAGFQLTQRNGLIRSTQLLYKRKNRYYYFDINQPIEFVERYEYTRAEISSLLQHAYFEIDGGVS